MGYERVLERDWLQVSPSALTAWEHLRLEPASTRRNMLYCVVHADSSPVLESATFLMAQLTAMYELLQLGQHVPCGDTCFPIGSVCSLIFRAC